MTRISLNPALASELVRNTTYNDYDQVDNRLFEQISKHLNEV
jgi:hypothetical protein